MNLQEIYKNKKVFLTGHTGFKGSWLLAWLHLLGANVKGYALTPDNHSNIYSSINGDNFCESVIHDIRDADHLQSAIISFEPDFVFHLAAQPLVRLSYERPVETFSVNAIGTANVLNALRFLEKPCIAVMITTDKVYHNKEKEYYYTEDDRLGGYDPYSASKASAEIIIDSYRNSFFNPAAYNLHQKSIAVARAGNVIGGGDWAKDRIIPDIIKGLIAEKPIEVRNPNAIRPWQFVLEPLCGYLMLAAQQLMNPIFYADAFNFGPYPSDNLTVEEIVKQAIEIWGSGTYFMPALLQAPHEAGLLHLDINKAMERINWRPKYEAKVAIKYTLDWYKTSRFNQAQIVEFTFSQIKKYADA